MKGYIDVHAHIIPGIDDGSKSNAETLAMLGQAYEAGIRTVIATPHFSKGFCHYEKEDVQKYCKALEKYVKQHIAPDFRIFIGQEILYNEHSLEQIQKGQVIPLAGSRYILLEFEPNIPYMEMFRALREIAMTAYYPVLAHVERYVCLREKGRVEEIKNLGVQIQMNYAHVDGKWHDKNVQWCRKALKAGLVDMMGTDMHDAVEKGPRVEKAVEWMQKNLDVEYIEEITALRAKRILEEHGSDQPEHMSIS